jgi:hypothetical protein
MSSRAKRSRTPGSSPQRECVSLRDLTDCLLDAYDCVARRAHEKYLERGSVPGGELEDWLSAERELLLEIPIDIQESEECVYALASVPNPTGAGVSIGIEPRWLVIVAHPQYVPASRSANVPAEASQHSYARKELLSGCDLGCTDRTEGVGALARSFSIRALPAAIDPTRSVAVLSEGLLGIRMPKAAQKGSGISG